jgi:uncharacterized membrane protein YfhO
MVTLDGAFVGIVVPPTDATLRLAYAPRFFWVGAAVSGVALLACIATLGLPRHRITPRGVT